jgi:two-component system OmpR family sensor kinase
VPIRIRLTLAFTAVMAAVLVAVGLFVYGRVGSDLDHALDTSLRTRADDLAATASAAGSDPIEQVRPRLVERDESLAQVIGPSGDVLYGSPGFENVPLLAGDELARAHRSPVFVDRDSVSGFDERVRLLARPAGGRVAVVGATREDRDEALSSLRSVLLVGGPIALLLAALAAYGVATAALRPVNAMRGEAAEISRLGSGLRLPAPPGRDELAELGGTLNEMLDRLERSAERERGFVASASHELRTPLALLRAELELALREGRSREELREAVASAPAESDRLVQLAEDLLVLARADEGRLPVRAERLDAGELLATTARRFEARAAESGRELRVEGSNGLAVHADRMRAEQALANLVDNALRHGEGAVELVAEPAGDGVRLHVLDRGPGFDPALDGRAFERFTRGDRARSRGGTGLGLAIVEAIARSHGRAAGAGRREGGGADAWIELPGSHSDLIRAN